MYTRIALVVLMVGLLYSGSYIFELRNDLKQTQTEFTDYKKEVSKKFEDMAVMQREINAIKKGFHKAQQKAMSDALREDVVVQKPKLVEKQLNRSFNNLMNEINEASK